MWTKSDVPTASELRTAAAARGHDPLGLSTDPEALVALVHTARRRFLAEHTPDALSAWLDLVGQLRSLPDPEPTLQHSVDREVIGLETARQMLQQTFAALSIDGDAVRLARSRLSSDEQEEIEESIELDYHSDRGVGGPTTTRAAGGPA